MEISITLIKLHANSDKMGFAIFSEVMFFKQFHKREFLVTYGYTL